MNLHNREAFLRYSTVFLFVLLLITMGLAAATDVQPLRMIHWNLRDVGIGVIAALLMMLVFSFAIPARKQAEDILGPSLAACHWYHFIPLSILVGIIEELLFRGVLESWASQWHPLLGFIGINVLFGMLHAVSITYAVVATLLGMILSWLAHGIDEMNLLRPIVAHAVYDYIGFVWISRTWKLREHSEEFTNPATVSENDADEGELELPDDQTPPHSSR